MSARNLQIKPLWMTSVGVGAGLIAGLVAFLFVLEELGIVVNGLVFPLVIFFATLSFLISPFLLDLQLKFIGSLQWVAFGSLPDHLQKFVRKVCAEQGIPVPRFGWIDDGGPTAFTYGNWPANARLVLSRGMMELLEEDELEAVVAHEIGHIRHWDFVLMSVAQLIPLILYNIYRQIMRPVRAAQSTRRVKGAEHLAIVAAIAYVLYIVSEYIVLFLSRIREYHADRFSVQVRGDGLALVKALVKIGYGFLLDENSNFDDKTRAKDLGVLNAFNISSNESNRTFRVMAARDPISEGVNFPKELLAWDLWNPWAQFYELRSTHPQMAKRILAISDFSTAMGFGQIIEFDLKQPESYWDEFFIDLAWLFAPVISVFVGFLLLMLLQAKNPNTYLFFGVVALGVGFLIKTIKKYPDTGRAKKVHVKTLLPHVEVSSIRTYPVHLRGFIMGRGVPGNVLNEDMYLQDDTGIIYLDYNNPWGIPNFFFAIAELEKYKGHEVDVIGWYRRAPVPYIEIETIRSGEFSDSSNVLRNRLLALFVFAVLAIALVRVLARA